jgi:hypothetical protein
LGASKIYRLAGYFKSTRYEETNYLGGGGRRLGWGIRSNMRAREEVECEPVQKIPSILLLRFDFRPGV